MNVPNTDLRYAEGLVFALSQAESTSDRYDWNERETVAYDAFLNRCSDLQGVIARDQLFFGGDRLRPYVTVNAGECVFVVSKGNSEGAVPGFLHELEGTKYGSVEMISLQDPSSSHRVSRITSTPELRKRLSVPDVYLASLTNSSRYQTSRLPLNVARLAQWVRFQHVGRVRAVDLALTFKGSIDSLCRDLSEYKPHVLGLSVNFGELETLRLLIETIRKQGLLPTIGLGNVLAAWAPGSVAEICRGFQTFISLSYGEADLERVCRLFLDEDRGPRTIEFPILTNNATRSEPPPTIVFPDEALVVETLKAGGQVSIETSFGCQYSHCSFCPRDHRGAGWVRPPNAERVVSGLARLMTNVEPSRPMSLSIVDEDAFGQEGLEGFTASPSIIALLKSGREYDVTYEIYTRLEQLFDRRRLEADTIKRLRELMDIKKYLSRVFVGVESGCQSQLRRYAKGQTPSQIVDALRAGSLIGLPLEFGFITFDPLLTQSELVENIDFLARTDILLQAHPCWRAEEVRSAVLDATPVVFNGGVPIYSKVAYMATELELFVNSRYAGFLSKHHPRLMGDYDPSFGRYDYRYLEATVAEVASLCRVWTEGTFRPMYRLRLARRASAGRSNSMFQEVIHRYREATFGLLTMLTSAGLSGDVCDRLCKYVGDDLRSILGHRSLGPPELHDLWRWVVARNTTSDIELPEFDFRFVEERRAS